MSDLPANFNRVFHIDDEEKVVRKGYPINYSMQTVLPYDIALTVRKACSERLKQLEAEALTTARTVLLEAEISRLKEAIPLVTYPQRKHPP